MSDYEYERIMDNINGYKELVNTMIDRANDEQVKGKMMRYFTRRQL